MTLANAKLRRVFTNCHCILKIFRIRIYSNTRAWGPVWCHHKLPSTFYTSHCCHPSNINWNCNKSLHLSSSLVVILHFKKCNFFDFFSNFHELREITGRYLFCTPLALHALYKGYMHIIFILRGTGEACPLVHILCQLCRCYPIIAKDLITALCLYLSVSKYTAARCRGIRVPPPSAPLRLL